MLPSVLMKLFAYHHHHTHTSEYNPQAQYSSDPFSPAPAHPSSASSAGVFQGQLVDMLLNSDLAGGFSLSSGAGGAQDYAQQMQMHRMRQGRPTIVTAEMIQTDIRNK